MAAEGVEAQSVPCVAVEPSSGVIYEILIGFPIGNNVQYCF